MQNYQPECSLYQTAVLLSQLVLMKEVLYSHAFQWDPGASLFSPDATVVPVRRKIPLLGKLP